ncbi:hypothetical protein ACHAXR_010759 [Thalassiosira sp. AJA248-18]
MAMQHGFGTTASSLELLIQVKHQSQSNRSLSCDRRHASSRSTRSTSRSRRTSGRRSQSGGRSRRISTDVDDGGSDRRRSSPKSIASLSTKASSTRLTKSSRSTRTSGPDYHDARRDKRRGRSNNGKSVASRSTRTSSRSTKTSRTTVRTPVLNTSNQLMTASSSHRSIDPDGQVDNAVDNDHEHNDFARSARSKKMAKVEMRIAEVNQYAAIARQKASLMTNYDFEGGNGHAFENDGNDASKMSRKSSSRSKSRSDRSKKYNDGRSLSRERRSVRSAPTSRRPASKSRRRSQSQTRDVYDHDSNEFRSNPKSSPPTVVPDIDEDSVPVTIPPLRPYNISPVSFEAEMEVNPRYMTGTTIEAGHTTVSSMSSTDSYVKKLIYLRIQKRREFEARRQQRQEERKKSELEGYFYEGIDNDATVDMEEEDPYAPSSSRSRDYRQTRAPSPLSSEKMSHGNSRRSRASSSSVHRTPTVASPIVSQHEEFCIKHPHVLLSDQVDINIWTCMRYCKDPESGRWHTVMMVCRDCLAEEEDGQYCNDTSYHSQSRRLDLRGFHPHGTRSGFDMVTDDDVTCSQSSQELDRDGQHHQIHRETIDVHPLYGGNLTPLEQEAEAQRRRFIRRLAARAYHFPGNTWCEDFIQYTCNTHLVFGIFFHHPLHPVTSRERCVILLGSVASGLLTSNLIYLWFVHAELGMDDTVLSLEPSGTFDVTKLMITLWTLGSMVHTLFDLSIWHIKACTLCRYYHGNYVSDSAVNCGRMVGVTIVLATLACATYLVLLRASEDYKSSLMDDVKMEHDDGDKSFLQPVSLGGAKYFDFLLGYIIEFVLAVFVYNPLILTIVFTGVLGCKGRIPILGGRPREAMREQKYAMKRQRYTMPQTLKLGDQEYEADVMYGDKNQKLTNF